MTTIAGSVNWILLCVATAFCSHQGCPRPIAHSEAHEGTTATAAILSFRNFRAPSARYGDRYLEEGFFYHLTRKDIKHNFSLYFYPLYLASGTNWDPRLVSLGPFVPQLLLVAVCFVAFTAVLS